MRSGFVEAFYMGLQLGSFVAGVVSALGLALLIVFGMALGAQAAWGMLRKKL